MAGTAAQFKIDVSKWVAGAKEKTRLVAVETVHDLNEAAVARTPVKTGNLRRSWFGQVNVIPSGMPGKNVDPIAQATIAAAGLKVGDVYYMGNTAAYARRLEYGFVGEDSLGRTYNQAGRFFVRSVMNEASQIAIRAAQRVASGKLGGERPGGGGALPDKGFVAP